MNNKSCLILTFLLLALNSNAQYTTILDSSESGTMKVIAGNEYKRSGLHQFFWGKNYRREWTTPVRIPVLNPDNFSGGISPLRMGGGRQTETLHFLNGSGDRYVFRSVNKTYTRALPEIAQGSFVESIANDQISTNHPYGALIVPTLASAAGVYHTNPEYYVMKRGDSLQEFNDLFAGMLGLLEERPDKTHTDEESFGEPDNIISTENMLEKITEENDHFVDQNFYVKTRLLDMLMGDWGRHQDNWRWAKFDEGPFKIYRPVPKDRDQIFAVFEGFLMGIIKGVAGLDQLQSFDHSIKDIRWYNFPALDIDRRFTNAVGKQVWTDSARALQNYLTDAVIDNAVRNMPPEIYALSGKDLADKIRSRRNDIVKYAEDYYSFLTSKVDIAGSLEKEIFRIEKEADGTRLSIVRVNKKGEVKQETFNRKFLTHETSEIRIYGLDGNDVFHITGNANNNILVRLIGGNSTDSLVVETENTSNLRYYGLENNVNTSGNSIRMKQSHDSLITRYNWEERKIPSSGLKKTLFYDDLYRFHIGLGYGFTTHSWRKDPYGAKHAIGLNYSLTENSFHPYYRGTIIDFVGKWALDLRAGYDGARRVNFFGIGNESELITQNTKFHWLRTSHYYSGLGLSRRFLDKHQFRINFLYDGVKVLPKEGRLVSKDADFVEPSVLDYKHFGSATVGYDLMSVDDNVVPSKGFYFNTALSFTQNLEEKNRSFRNLTGNLGLYIPIASPLTLAIKAGAATMSGEPEFYQLNTLGGNFQLRGFERFRFYSKHHFYNQNELRWLPEVRSRIFNGRAGLMALLDNGRAWHPGETSDKWHFGYGGGIILVPFNKLGMGLTYAVSKEDREFNFRFFTYF
jgi:hypothetical protein